MCSFPTEWRQACLSGSSVEISSSRYSRPIHPLGVILDQKRDASLLHVDLRVVSGHEIASYEQGNRPAEPFLERLLEIAEAQDRPVELKIAAVFTISIYPDTDVSAGHRHLCLPLHTYHALYAALFGFRVELRILFDNFLFQERGFGTRIYECIELVTLVARKLDNRDFAVGFDEGESDSFHMWFVFSGAKVFRVREANVRNE